ncbi:MAG: terpene cyclase/mutase family protein, partial [Isosphaeraceae bacterium]|nr:terpene cyclase/mutase family protein [Isosphaeraceae bacterium]
APRRPAAEAPALALARVTPSGVARLPEVTGRAGGRPLFTVPEVYRSRLDPNRSARAQRAGASAESEQAVERALDWLARHQDSDGRWDAATAKYDDGSAKKGDDDFTVHCPPGETCFGECIYWEADTALTGLALLAYLGAGYTQTDGKYSQTVARGLDFLLREQKPDGDLRGVSRAVGMYCHAMATLALCEAYALSRDDRLLKPVEQAVGFLVHSRARDGMSWRYSPHEARGDTSILGWAVLALKSARLVGVAVPPDTQTGALAWLDQVSGGTHKGLARYLPGKPVTPTMTAEAWVCRQFLGVGGPGAASEEAAEYLLAHGPDRDPYNLYYWYYGTLALYQHGGSPWARWNAQVRDQIVHRQRAQGHSAGSWDPDDSEYGTSGGRVYCTALATLSLEVYYRFLRLYEAPQIPPALTPAPRRDDANLRRLSNPPTR